MIDHKKVWINGKPKASVPVTDRALLYGDGIFETIRVVAGTLSFESLHWQRLMMGCLRLGIELDADHLKEEIDQFLHWGNSNDSILKVIITRGSGDRGYNPQNCHSYRRLLSLHPLPAYPTSLSHTGVRVILCQTRLGQSALAGIKHLNRLEQVMACSEWSDSNYQEGLLLSFDNYLIEGTMSNLFLIDNTGALVTPLLDKQGVAGVCRQYIINQATAWGFNIKEMHVPLTALSTAQEIFLCNSVNGIWPVVACEQYKWSVGHITQTIRDNVAGILNA